MSNKKTQEKFDKLHNERRARRARERITMKTLYAIYDIVAEIMLDHIIITRADAAAIRAFDDIMSAKEPNGINNHPADFNLISIGWIKEFRSKEEDKNKVEIVADFRIILEGKTWLAMKENATTAGQRSPAVAVSLGETAAE